MPFLRPAHVWYTGLIGRGWVGVGGQAAERPAMTASGRPKVGVEPLGPMANRTAKLQLGELWSTLGVYFEPQLRPMAVFSTWGRW